MARGRRVPPAARGALAASPGAAALAAMTVQAEPAAEHVEHAAADGEEPMVQPVATLTPAAGDTSGVAGAAGAASTARVEHRSHLPQRVHQFSHHGHPG